MKRTEVAQYWEANAETWAVRISFLPKSRPRHPRAGRIQERDGKLYAT